MLHVKIKKILHTDQGHYPLNVDIACKPGEVLTFFGPSGAGKTILLRMIAGLTDPDEGIITLNDKYWFDSSQKINVPAHHRKLGFVLQDTVLFPHLNLRENLVFALGHEDALIDELLKMTGLDRLTSAKPHQLSGGQKQRVALIRAVLRQPSLLLLDEPLSALDITTRLNLQDEIRRIHERFNLMTIFVSHDWSEVFKLSHRVLMIEQGRIIQEGKPQELAHERTLSSKFHFTGSVINIQHEEIVSIVTIQIGQHFTKVVATRQEAEALQIGERVSVFTKAFHPIIQKIN